MQTRLAATVLVAFWCVVVPIASGGSESSTRFEVTDFLVKGANPLAPSRTTDILAPFLGEHTSIEAIHDAAKALENEIHELGRRLDRVTVPPQNLTNQVGVVTLEVTTVRVGEVSVEGQEHFSESNILRSLPPLERNNPVDVVSIDRAAALANRHPTKELSISFAPAEQPDRVDARVQVRDQSPHQPVLWLNNSGTERTGEARIGASYQYTNLFDRDHEVAWSYSTSPDQPDDVAQYGATYRWPFYDLGGDLFLYGSKTDTDSGVIAEVLDVSGKGTVLGARYTHYFPNYKNLKHQAQLGFESKLFENDIDFQGAPVGVDVRSQPLSLRYAGNWRRRPWRIGIHVGANANLGISSLNDDETYAQSRAGADSSWRTYDYGVNVDYWLGAWLVRGALTGQHASEPLISGEAFGLGGFGSIRGFEPRELVGDRGKRGSLEIWTPALRDGLRFLVFIDAGEVRRLNPQPGEFSEESVASTGMGIRWWWRDSLSFRLDYGYVLNGLDAAAGSDSTTDNDGRLHFSASYRF